MTFETLLFKGYGITDVLDQLDNGVLVVDRNGIITWGNKRYFQITGINPAEWTGKEVGSIARAGKLSIKGGRTMKEIVEETRQPLTKMIDYIEKKDIICTANPIFDDSGAIEWYVYTLIDSTAITELRRKLREQEMRAEASEKQLQEIFIQDKLKQNQIIVQSKRMQNIFSLALRLAQINATVLIMGQSGVGKDVIAKFIHESGKRKDNKFVHINCGAIPEGLFESELFGHEEGAFTGAAKKGKIGLIELADGGTLFLDEIGDIPLSMQVKLLGVLQDKKLTRVGGKESKDIDVRVIAATNKDLRKMVEEKKFREDLFYRINIVSIDVPPLSERKTEIPLLISSFLSYFNNKYELNKHIDSQAVDRLMAYSWPGNVRELRHTIERLVVICLGDVITTHDLPEEFIPGKSTDLLFDNFEEGKTLKEFVDIAEKMKIRYALMNSSGLKEAAESLGIDLSTLTRKKQKFGLKKNIY